MVTSVPALTHSLERIVMLTLMNVLWKVYKCIVYCYQEFINNMSSWCTPLSGSTLSLILQLRVLSEIVQTLLEASSVHVPLVGGGTGANTM